MKKHRNNPKRHCNYQISNTTLDLRHKLMINEFDNTPYKLEGLYKDKDSLIKRLEVLQSIHKSNITDDEIKDIVHIQDKLKLVSNEIDSLEYNKLEIDYFTNTSEILYNYYDLLENNCDESTNIHTINSKKSIAQYFTSPNKNDNAYDDNINVNGGDMVSVTSITSNINNTNCIKQMEIKIKNDSKYNRAYLLDSYLSKTDENYINNNINHDDGSMCVHCNHNSKDILVNEGIICCRNCYTIEHIITDNEKPSYKDPPKEISYFSYKRINHFSEWLNQIQGKETTDIPEEVFDKIMVELNKQRIYNLINVTTSKIREILKKHKINKYYEHIPYILNKITGIPNPHLNSDLEDKLKNMFKEIQVPFLKYSPTNRKNFLSYSYVLHKFIQLLDETEFLKYFPLLKSRDKLHQQEQIWKKICEELNWKFIRSI